MMFFPLCQCLYFPSAGRLAVSTPMAQQDYWREVRPSDTMRSLASTVEFSPTEPSGSVTDSCCSPEEGTAFVKCLMCVPRGVDLHLEGSLGEEKTESHPCPFPSLDCWRLIFRA